MIASTNQPQRLGVALSGGGVRAAAFHLGVLSGLHDAGLLSSVDVLSTVSGGSITGAYYLLVGEDFPSFKDKMIRALQRSIELRSIVNWRSLGLLWPGYSLTNIKAATYDELYFGGRTLAALRKRPQLIINATNLVSGKNFKLSQDFIGDWKTGYDGLPSVMSIANAVAASTAVPGIFRPIRLKTKTYFPQTSVAAKHLVLCDGGVYDNQGTHALTSNYSPEKNRACTHIICSDASAPFDDNLRRVPVGALAVLRRQSDAMMARIKNIQYQQLLYGEYSQTIKTAYFSIGWTFRGILERVPATVAAELGIAAEVAALKSHDGRGHDGQEQVDSALQKLGLSTGSHLSDAATRTVASIGTRLRALTEEEVSLLIAHGASLCRLQVRLYLHTLQQSH